MKVKISLENGETIEEAEAKLEKSVEAKKKARKRYHEAERYPSQVIEDFHDHVVKKHEKLVQNVMKEVQDMVKKDIRGV